MEKEIANLKCPFCGYVMEVEIPGDKCLIFLEVSKIPKIDCDAKGECCVICVYSDKKYFISKSK